MNTINLETILKLKPCQDRLDNYIKYYSDKEFAPRQFMGLKNITHADKLWVAFRLIPKQKLRLALADIAESVLHIFEKSYPNDLRPRGVIEAMRNGSVDHKEIYDASAAVVVADRGAYRAASYAASAIYRAVDAAYHDAYAVSDAAHAVSEVVYHASAAESRAIDAAVASAVAIRMSDTGYSPFSWDEYNNILRYQKRIRTIILKYWK